MRKRSLAVLCALASGPFVVRAQSPPGLTVVNTYAAMTFSLPGPLGGLEFSTNGSTLFVGSVGGGIVVTFAVQRNPVTGQVTGLGTPPSFWTFYSLAPSIDGGLQFEPGGLLFHTQYPANGLGEIAPSPAGGVPIAYYTLPTPSTVGGLTLVSPAGGGPADLVVSSYGDGDLYRMPLTPAPGGSLAPGAPILVAALPPGSEGFRYLPAGANKGDVLLLNWSADDVVLVEMTGPDPFTSQPIGGSAAPLFVTFPYPLNGLEGLAIDPITGDLFVSTYGSDVIVHLTGALQGPALARNTATLSVSAGGTVAFGLRSGTTGGLRPYLLVATASGTSPGVPIGSVQLPINPDFVTLAVLEATNTPFFANFLGITNGFGQASATMNVPAGLVPPSAVGLVLDFAYLLLNPASFASNPVSVTVVP